MRNVFSIKELIVKGVFQSLLRLEWAAMRDFSGVWFDEVAKRPAS